MKNLIRLSLCSLLFTSIIAHSVFGQEELKQEKKYKNTVRLNLTNPLIFGEKSLVLGYERIIGEHRSFSINAGLAHLPKFSFFGVRDSITELKKSEKERGFNVCVDYRFYLQTENKYPTPHGIYLAPYFGYTTMGRQNTWTLNTDNFQGDVITKTKLNITVFGGEMGYQFILWKRVALDFVLIGPGLAFYSLKSKLDTTLSADDESLLYQKINDALKDKFPGYSFVLDDVDFERTGTSNVTAAGFRYVIHLGFRF